MSSDKHCCVPGCKESGGSHKVLHGFPNPKDDKHRFNMWLYAIGSSILGLENERIHKYRRVCRSHFAEKYLCRNNRLSKTAVPTLNMPGLTLNIQDTLTEQRPMRKVLTALQPSTSKAPVSITYEVGLDCKSIDCDERISKGIEVIEKENYDPALGNVVDNETSHTQPPIITTNVAPHFALNRAINMKKTRHFTVKEKTLHTMIVAAKRKIKKLQSKVKKQSAEIKAAKKMTSNPAVLNMIENCSSSAKIIMEMQWRENRKKGKGRRFTMQEKILSLCILKQSPKAYNFFRKIFILPAPQTLVKLVQSLNLRPGLNKNIFAQLKKKAQSMKVEEKLCVLLFDEISLKAHLSFNQKKDKVTGFVDDGYKRQPEIADHAQVFMVRGLLKNYKQPISYTFSASATKGTTLANQIKDVVKELQKCGLIVVASVCDQGTNNRQAIKILLNETRGVYLRKGETPKDNIILINNQEIVPLYDPPHLLKGIRNNLLNKNLHFVKDDVQKTAKWSHLQLLNKENPGYKGIRLIPKLTENHVNPEKINKMKVKYASQIFSRTVASNMGYLADKGILPEACKDTADLLLFMDNIFDSVNGSYKKNKFAKPLLGPATEHSVHNKTWAEGKNVFKSMKFKTSAGKEESVPTVANWIWTLDGIQILLKKLKKEYSISSVWLRHLNQDPLENFFGGIRSHGCRNNNPTCDQFESAATTLLVNNLSNVHSQGKNCEEDFCKALYSLVISENPEPPSTSTFDFSSIMELDFSPISEKENDPRKIAPLQYVSGYFIKKAKTNIFKNCMQCKIDLCNEDQIEYIKYREYAGKRWLCTPNNELTELVSNMQDIINFILKNNLEKTDLKEIIKTSIIILLDFNLLKCLNHKEDLTNYLISIVSRCLIMNYCKDINRILSGRKLVDDEEDNMQMKAKKYQNKCFKRKKI
ncbi:unnamed protein product [Chilo suppressalis]|uniref:THAP-type domain-containing protein n=1 Tax=Chilo suppressalis TaxID=168631 RepID=A0ABN8L6N9_CHISP|nr:unnamed protein product [Chilo suppressalis]